jgi:isopentenyl-diphosphate delta-isomerase
MCPVYVGRAGGTLRADPDEVGATAWEEWDSFSESVLRGERDVSPWCRQQVADLVEALGREWDGTGSPAPADPALLPEAARPV